MAWGLQGLGVGSRAAPGAHSRQDGRHPEQILRRFDDFGFHNTRQQTRCQMLLAVRWRAEAQQAGALKVKKISVEELKCLFVRSCMLVRWWSGRCRLPPCLSGLGPPTWGQNLASGTLRGKKTMCLP